MLSLFVSYFSAEELLLTRLGYHKKQRFGTIIHRTFVHLFNQCFDLFCLDVLILCAGFECCFDIFFLDFLRVHV